MNRIIRTTRLTLRTLGKESAEEVLAFLLENRIFLKEWEPARTEDFFTLQHQRQLLQQDELHTAAGMLFKVWITKDERIIGSVALNNIVRGSFLSCHLGYRMAETEQRKGYMTEAVRAVIDIAFHELELHRIEANIMPRNTASLKVVEKLGFHHEGLARKYLKINDRWEDHIHMVLLNEDME